MSAVQSPTSNVESLSAIAGHGALKHWTVDCDHRHYRFNPVTGRLVTNHESKAPLINSMKLSALLVICAAAGCGEKDETFIYLPLATAD